MTEPAAAASSGPGPGPGEGTPGRPQLAPASLLQTLQLLWLDLPGLLSDRIELLSLELQRAGAALAQIVALIVAATILGVTAWLVLWGAIVAALWSMGLHLGWALLLALAVNLLVAALAVLRVRRLLPLLRLPATRRHLVFGSTPKPAADDPPPSRAAGPVSGPVDSAAAT